MGSIDVCGKIPLDFSRTRISSEAYSWIISVKNLAFFIFYLKFLLWLLLLMLLLPA